MPTYSATSASTSARSRTPSASFGGWLLSQEHTRVSVPGLTTGNDSHLLLQFSAPVHVAHKLRPALEPHMVVGVHRPPCWTDRLTPQHHACLARRAIGLTLVAC